MKKISLKRTGPVEKVRVTAAEGTSQNSREAVQKLKSRFEQPTSAKSPLAKRVKEPSNAQPENKLETMHGCLESKKPVVTVNETVRVSKSVEKDLIRDLLFIFQGIDGRYIKCDSHGIYHISTELSAIPPHLREQTLKLAELGTMFKIIRDYCKTPFTGLIRLTHAFEMELLEFYRILALVESEIKKVSMLNCKKNNKELNCARIFTMAKLRVRMFNYFVQFELLISIIKACKGKKGGEICSVLYLFTQHADPLISKLSTAVLTIACKPMFFMLCNWILFGRFDDPHEEFFIGLQSCPRQLLWQEKYHIREKMLPSFITKKNAERILATGKNINFLRDICQNSESYKNRRQMKEFLEKSPIESMFFDEGIILNPAIEKAYKATSEMVMKVIIQDCHFMYHLQSIKKFLLLGQGDFGQYLMESIYKELSKPADKLFYYNLSANVDSAVKTASLCNDTEDIQNRLGIRLFPGSDTDMGWDVFSLDYRVNGPIETILTEDAMAQYHRLFLMLWKMKRIERILFTLWKIQNYLYKRQRTIPALSAVLHRSQLLIHEMMHFVTQMHYYIMFEAIECAWDDLMEHIDKSSDLDQMIVSHTKFLDTIIRRSLLDPQCTELLSQLKGILEGVFDLEKFLTELNECVSAETRALQRLEQSKERDAKKGHFASLIMEAKGKIEKLYITNQVRVREFLLCLHNQEDLALQNLRFRLDFNEYYHPKDSRLTLPLKFQCLRLSSRMLCPPSTGTSPNSSVILDNSDLHVDIERCRGNEIEN